MKILNVPSNKEAMKATIQRKPVQDLETSNHINVGLDVCLLCDNHHISLKLLEFKCTLAKVVKWKLFTVILHDEIVKACPRIFKLQALKDGHHFDFQDRRVSLKYTYIIMTSNV